MNMKQRNQTLSLLVFLIFIACDRLPFQRQRQRHGGGLIVSSFSLTTTTTVKSNVLTKVIAVRRDGGDGSDITMNYNNPMRHHGVGTCLNARRSHIEQSAFGKAAIGRKRRNTSYYDDETKEPSLQSDDDDDDTGGKTTGSILKQRQYRKQSSTITNRINISKKFAKGQQSSSSPSSIQNNINMEQTIQQRDEALVALKEYTKLPLHTCIDVLNNHSEYYTDIPDLPKRLHYLRHHINIKPKQLQKMIISHPRLMIKVLSETEDLSSTVEVLQSELDLSISDIQNIQSISLPAILSYPRSELRQRILVYKNDLAYSQSQIRKMVLKDPRMLRTNKERALSLLQVLSEELDINQNEVDLMLEKEILLFTYKAEENIRTTIRYLKEYEVGKCLGMVHRKGVSTLDQDNTSIDNEEIVKSRLKVLIMGHPQVLSSSIEKNLKPTVSFFLEDNVGLTEYEFGRVVYRRGGTLLEANVERTLKRKVSFLREQLGLELDPNMSYDDDTEEEEDDDDEEDGSKKEEADAQIPIPTPNDKTALTNKQKQRLFAQMIATNPDILTLSIENNLSPKFDYFTSVLGFTQEQLRYVMLKRPQLLALSLERNIIPKMDYFMKERDDNDGDGGGLGMSVEEVRRWIVNYPQSLAFAWETRIRLRIRDVTRNGLFGIGDGSNQIPGNFVSRSDKSWNAWLKDHALSEEE